jgi:SanA protein
MRSRAGCRRRRSSPTTAGAAPTTPATAPHVFLVEEAILVTQEFHLPRAVFTCETLGVSATGVIADMREYHPRSIGWSESREVAALLRALYDVVLERPAAVMGEPIPLR